MRSLSTIHTNELSIFHRNYFLISINSLNILDELKEYKDSERHFSFDSIKKRFPNILNSGILRVLNTVIKIKSSEGVNDFLIIYDDSNMEESLDLASGLASLFNVKINHLMSPPNRDREQNPPITVWSDLVEEIKDDLVKSNITTTN